MDLDFNRSWVWVVCGFFFYCQDGKASIVSWMLTSAYPTPAYMASVFRRTPALVMPVSVSLDLW